jgi:plastocyanin
MLEPLALRRRTEDMRLLLSAALLAALIPAPVQATDAAAPVTVHIRDDKFVPAAVTIATGGKIVFINDDDDAHTVTADDGSWDSEGLNQGQQWSRAFPKVAKIAYHCTVHPFMKGTIVVRSTP